jgi:hypothetical protein
VLPNSTDELPHPPEGTAAGEAARVRVDPWSHPSPTYSSAHLPGGGLVIYIAPHRSIALPYARSLHGLITDLIGEGHDPRRPLWSLIPWSEGSGWGVYLHEERHVARLAGGHFDAKLFEHAVRVSFSKPGGVLVHRVRVPAPIVPGRYVMRIDAVTPVSVRHTSKPAGTVVHLVPTGANLLAAVGEVCRRVGLPSSVPETARIHLLHRATTPERVYCGDHLGATRGWTGTVYVEANAPGAWLLELAARVGLGGRTALGFGRIRVTQATEAELAGLTNARPPSPMFTPRGAPADEGRRTWIITEEAASAYAGRFGLTRAAARQSILLDLLHGRREDAHGGREVWAGPAPRRARFEATVDDDVRTVVAIRPTARPGAGR